MRQSKIILPEDGEALQLNLFGSPERTKILGLDPFPTVLLDTDGFHRILERAKTALGVDFEFRTLKSGDTKASIIGIANLDLAAAIFYTKEHACRVLDVAERLGLKLVAYSLFADKPIIDEAVGRVTPLSMWRDGMVTHFLENQDFAKAPDKTEDDDDSGSLGFMNLFTAMSMTTNAYQYKICRKTVCEGPCPRHKVFDYCAVDSWGGLISDTVNRERLAARGVREELIDEMHELAEVCHLMEKHGVRVDLPYIEKVSKEIEEEKDKLFSYDVISGQMDGYKKQLLESLDDKKAVKEYRKNAEKKEVREYAEFNPRSGDQVLEFFKNRHIELKSNEKSSIKDVLNTAGTKLGFSSFDKFIEHLGEQPPATGSDLDVLFRLFRYKDAGKGTDAWFGEKYIQNGNEIHPRFIPIGGSSMGRLASSKPNFQNIPVKGWGKRLKKGVLPIDPDNDFLESDFSQLELRGVLYQAGVGFDAVGGDAFMYLVNSSGGLFTSALAMTAFETERDLAKSVSHAADYLEGIEILYPADFMKPKVQREIFNGALRVYSKKYMPSLKKDWEYCGGIVAFTGANLADRFFGDHSDENRKKALQIQEDVYFAKFPMIREWHRSVLEEIESKGFVTGVSSRFLRLYGTPRDNAKMGAAFKGQGFGADHVQAVMIKFKRLFNLIADLQVHDSLLFEIPKKWSDKQAAEFILPMFEESGIRFPGFRAPGSMKNPGGALRGPSYGDLRKLVLA